MSAVQGRGDGEICCSARLGSGLSSQACLRTKSKNRLPKLKKQASQKKTCSAILTEGPDTTFNVIVYYNQSF